MTDSVTDIMNGDREINLSNSSQGPSRIAQMSSKMSVSESKKDWLQLFHDECQPKRSRVLLPGRLHGAGAVLNLFPRGFLKPLAFYTTQETFIFVLKESNLH